MRLDVLFPLFLTAARLVILPLERLRLHLEGQLLYLAPERVILRLVHFLHILFVMLCPYLPLPGSLRIRLNARQFLSLSLVGCLEIVTALLRGIE